MCRVYGQMKKINREFVVVLYLCLTYVSRGSRLSHVSQVRITDKMLILNHNIDDNNKT